MNDLAISERGQLPATIEKLNEFILIGKEKIKVHQAKIRAITLVGMAETARRAAIEDGQDIAAVVIRAEARLGELLQATPRSYPLGSPGQTKTLPTGISKRTSHQAQTIAANPEKVEQIISDSRGTDKLPTPDMVYKLVKFDEAKARNDAKRTAVMPEGIFNVILCDPPWKYDNSGISGAAENHYPVMETIDICNMKIPSDDNSVLFLWVTNPFLKEGLAVCEAWGFNYKTNIVWIKEKAGQGFYVKGQHELLFICTKGSFLPDNSLYIRSVIEAKREDHSKKPDIFYQTIETLYPHGKYLEIFAREKRAGWESYGNQI